VRVPAALCGVVGFKPAYGALPDEGVYPLAPTLDHVGLFAATVDDAWLAYRALAGPDAGRSRLDRWPKVGWIRPGVIATTDPGVEAVCHDVLVRAGLAPATVAALPGWHRDQDLFQVFSTLQGREAFEVHQDHFDDDRHLIDHEVAARLERGRDVTAAAYEAADAARHELRASVAELLSAYNVLALPTVPLVAPKLDERRVRVGGSDLEVRSALLSLTSPWNMAGVPALSVPAGAVDGLPVGVQLVSAAGDEHVLFHAARAVQSAATGPRARHS
jgi:aspartyl-tRNA(Asn)/glutamyl-tRNA(Gln) amidotransferase subunit A